jgi:hypothetical protein
MKKVILILWGALLVHAANGQRWDMGSSFNYSRPTGGMARNIEQGFGITLEGARVMKNVPFAVGIEFSSNAYGRDKTRQQYTFDDGSVTETNVIVTNAFSNLFLTGKFFLRNKKLVNPYLSGKLGYSWYRTTLTIEDPEDVDGCQPLESDRLLTDGTFTASGGGGVRVDFSGIFTKLNSNMIFFDLSVHMTQGGTVEYMNVHKQSNHGTPDRDVMARFINNRTQVIHEHHVGHVYSSYAEMMEYRFGIIYRPHFGK